MNIVCKEAAEARAAAVLMKPKRRKRARVPAEPEPDPSDGLFFNPQISKLFHTPYSMEIVQREIEEQVRDRTDAIVSAAIFDADQRVIAEVAKRFQAERKLQAAQDHLTWLDFQLRIDPSLTQLDATCTRLETNVEVWASQVVRTCKHTMGYLAGCGGGDGNIS